MIISNKQKLSSMIRTYKQLPAGPELSLVNDLKNLPVEVAISKIERMEEQMKQMDQAEIPVGHYFGDGVYVREIMFKAGTIATGRVQKQDHVSIMISGHMTIWTPDDGVHDVYGPSITHVQRGMKRAGYAHTDTHWVCAYGIPSEMEYNTENIMDFLTFERYGEYLEFMDGVNKEGCKWLVS